MLKWALAREMPLFVCLSAEHRFTEKTFLPGLADREKSEGGSCGAGGFGRVTRGHAELWPLWTCSIDIWTRRGREKG